MYYFCCKWKYSEQIENKTVKCSPPWIMHFCQGHRWARLQTNNTLAWNKKQALLKIWLSNIVEIILDTDCNDIHMISEITKDT